MLYSTYFAKTKKQAPTDEISKNAQLLFRAGYVYKEMAGAYSYLPLGLRVVEKIKQIVREEMNAIGGQELIMTTLQRKELWEQTDRWDDEKVDIWFKSKLKSGAEVGFGWSHEEPISDMMKQYIQSYKDLPIFVYQFQTKLRNEIRAKSGIMRGREFVMKDMYSYCIDQKQHEDFYNRAIDAYMKVFARVGLEEDTFLTFASGGAFTEFSHEFQTLLENGEDTIFINKDKKIAINQEVMTKKTLGIVGVEREALEEKKASEVGNIFYFGTKKSEQLGVNFTNDQGKTTPVHLGSYGIGITRLMGVLVEKFADDKGIVWPESVAPFKVHLIGLNLEDTAVTKTANEIYEKLISAGIEILFDDRVDASAGEKFADADLLGIPYRGVVSKKSDSKIEFSRRTENETKIIDVGDVINLVNS